MKECLNCGYERQPKDEGIVPATECPRCGILYDKIKNGDEGMEDYRLNFFFLQPDSLDALL